MVYNTEAIVVRAVPYGETHVIVTLLTPEGMTTAMARGAKKPQSRLSAGCHLCAKAWYSIYQGRGMGTVQQVELLHSYRTLHERLDLAAYAAYFSELVRACSDDRPNGQPGVYHMFSSLLNRLETQDHEEGAEILARLWETKVLRFLGASPEWESCVRCGDSLEPPYWYSSREGGFVCGRHEMGHHDTLAARVNVPPKTSSVLRLFASVPMDRIGDIRLSSQTRLALKKILRIQLEDFAGLRLKSRGILDSLGFGLESAEDE